MFVHEFERKVSEYVKKHHLLVDGEHIIVALSGGADSVALLKVLLSMNVKITALHCNFGLRGDESDRDEKFTRDLCLKLGVELKVRAFNVAKYEQEHKVSTEMACRELRYEWFEEERISLGGDSIAIAHHHDDNVETLLLNLFRGSGIQGLAGIKPRNEKIIRPLLCVTRNEIEEYLRFVGLEYVIDSTNLENDFKRNKIRNVLIPTINELFPEAQTGISRSLENIYSCNEFYQEKVKELKDKVIQPGCNVEILDLEFLQEMGGGAETAMFELLKPYGFNSEQTKYILDSYRQRKQIGQHFYSQRYEVVLGRNKIEIFDKNFNSESVKNKSLEVDLCQLLVSNDENIQLKVLLKEFSKEGFDEVDGRNSIALSKDVLNISPVLTLRNWEYGDKMKPFGMKGTKLVSDLFTDAKFSEAQKRDAKLLCMGNEVLWVLGLRASRLFPVDKNDNEYIYIEYKKD